MSASSGSVTTLLRLCGGCPWSLATPSATPRTGQLSSAPTEVRRNPLRLIRKRPMRHKPMTRLNATGERATAPFALGQEVRGPPLVPIGRDGPDRRGFPRATGPRRCAARRLGHQLGSAWARACTPAPHLRPGASGTPREVAGGRERPRPSGQGVDPSGGAQRVVIPLR